VTWCCMHCLVLQCPRTLSSEGTRSRFELPLCACTKRKTTAICMAQQPAGGSVEQAKSSAQLGVALCSVTLHDATCLLAD